MRTERLEAAQLIGRWITGCLLLALLAATAGCKRPTHDNSPPTIARKVEEDKLTGTREMAELLKSIGSTINPMDTKLVMNRERAAMLKTALSSASDDAAGAGMRLQYVIELLNAGSTEEALAQLDMLEKQLKRLGPVEWNPTNRRTVRIWRAIANMRLGELQNCCTTNTADSCLLPIHGAGIHSRRQGSLQAITVLEQILHDNPKDLETLWLLNIASMTVDKYPGGVPKKWLIPPSAFASEADVGKFTNVASKIGLNLLGRSGGCIIDDFDGDGLLDIMVSGLGLQDQLRFFHNNGDGTFTDRTKEADLIGETGGLNMFQADYNNDGFPDVLVLRGGWMGKAGNFPMSLLRNNGDGTFSDVTKQAGLLKPAATMSAVWLDYNNDGKIDLFVGYESGAAGVFPCSLYRNNGDGTFTDVASSAGVDYVGFVKSVVSADYDNDGWPDIFVSVFDGKKLLFHNNGNGTFTDVADKAGIKGPLHSFGSFFFDYDNDGWSDLFVCGYKAQNVGDIANEYLGKSSADVERPVLYHNNHDGTFTDVTKRAHLDRAIAGMGLNFGDLDNDGFPDFYIGTGNPDLAALMPNRMFYNSNGVFFQDVTTSTDTGHLQKGHAVVFADLNNDGQQDIFAQMGGAYYGDIAYSALFANPGHKNHWITLKLEGVQSNRSAIGAVIKIVVNSASGQKLVYKTVGSGGSFGANPMRKEIGLGPAISIDHIEILWPVTRKTQIIPGNSIQMDSFWRIWEDRPAPEKLNLRNFRWPGM